MRTGRRNRQQTIFQLNSITTIELHNWTRCLISVVFNIDTAITKLQTLRKDGLWPRYNSPTQQEILAKQTIVLGTCMCTYSLDFSRWASNAVEAKGVSLGDVSSPRSAFSAILLAVFVRMDITTPKGGSCLACENGIGDDQGWCLCQTRRKTATSEQR